MSAKISGFYLEHEITSPIKDTIRNSPKMGQNLIRVDLTK